MKKKDLFLSQNRTKEILVFMVSNNVIPNYCRKIIANEGEKKILTTLTKEIEEIAKAKSIEKIVDNLIKFADENSKLEYKNLFAELNEIVKKYEPDLDFVVKDLKLLFFEAIEWTVENFVCEKSEELKRKNEQELEDNKKLRKEKENVQQQIKEALGKINILDKNIQANVKKNAWLIFCCDILPHALLSYSVQKNKNLLLQQVLMQTNLQRCFLSLKKLMQKLMLSFTWGNNLESYICDTKQENANEDFATLKKIIQSNIELPTIQGLSGDTVEIVGKNIVLSELLDRSEIDASVCKDKTSIRVQATGKIYIDCDLNDVRWKGKNIIICAPSIEVMTASTIDVSGRNSLPHAQSKAKNGNTGMNGEDGEHGLAGESAGNVCIKANNIINGDKLTIIANGGNGANGQDGGDGGEGQDGYDGADGKTEPLEGTSEVINIKEGTNGSAGKKGGNGGRAGLGGEGGFGGIIDIYVVDEQGNEKIVWKNTGKSGQDGVSGKFGVGGAGGKSGVDGVDDGRAWLSRGWGWQGEYINKKGKLEKKFIRHLLGWNSYDIEVIKTAEEVKKSSLIQAESGIQIKENTKNKIEKSKAIPKPKIDTQSMKLTSSVSSLDSEQILLKQKKSVKKSIEDSQSDFNEQLKLQQECEIKNCSYEIKINNSNQQQETTAKEINFFQKIKKKIFQLCEEKMLNINNSFTQQSQTINRVANYKVENQSTNKNTGKNVGSEANQTNFVEYDPPYDINAENDNFALLKKEDELLLQEEGKIYAAELAAIFEKINLGIMKNKAKQGDGIRLKQLIGKLLNVYKNKLQDEQKIKIILQKIYKDIEPCLLLEINYSHEEKHGKKNKFKIIIKDVCEIVGCEFGYLNLLLALRTKIDIKIFEKINKKLTANKNKFNDKSEADFLNKLLIITNVYKVMRNFQARKKVKDFKCKDFGVFCDALFFWLGAINVANIEDYVKEFCENFLEDLPKPGEKKEIKSEFLKKTVTRAQTLAANSCKSITYNQVGNDLKDDMEIDEGDGDDFAKQTQEFASEFMDKFNLIDCVNKSVDEFKKSYQQFIALFVTKNKKKSCIECLKIILLKLEFDNEPFGLSSLCELFVGLAKLNNINFAANIIENKKSQNWLNAVFFENLWRNALQIFAVNTEENELITLLETIENKHDVIKLLNVKILELQTSQLVINYSEFKDIVKLAANIDFSDASIIDIESLKKQPLFSYKRIFNVAILLSKLPNKCRDISYVNKIEKKYGLAILDEFIGIIGKKYKDTINSEEEHEIGKVFKKVACGKLIIGKNVLKKIEQSSVTNWKNILIEYAQEIKNKDLKLDDLIEAMKSENCQDITDKNFFENLQQDIKKIEEKKYSQILTSESVPNKEITSFTAEDIKQWAKKLNAQIIKEQTHEVIAVIGRAVQIVCGFYPRDTQLVALWLFVCDVNQKLNKLGQIATGEGKTLIVAMCAIFKALTGKHVDVVTSSSVLAKRDAKEMGKLFGLFNLGVANNCDDECRKNEDERKKRYGNHIVYGDVGSFQADILLDRFFDKEVKMGRRCNCLILDEVDSMMLDKCHNVLYLSHTIAELESLNAVFLHIWNMVNSNGIDNFSEEENIKNITICLEDLIEKGGLSVPNTLKGFIDKKIEIWIKNAFFAKKIEMNDPYTANSKSICVVDKDTGVSEPSMQWENGLHQFLQLKHSQKLSSESLKAVFISNYSYFKLYDEIIGLSGTLGSHNSRKLLKESYDFKQVFNLPRAKCRFFVEEKNSTCVNEAAWLKKIEEDVIVKCASKRAVLIVCENIKYAKMLKKYLAKRKSENAYTVEINLHKYTKSDQEFSIGNDMRPVRAGDVIIATNLAGRGTDLKIDKTVEEKGGIFVITTSLPANTRVQEQAFGRAARKGENGSGKFIICREHEGMLTDLEDMKTSDLQNSIDEQEQITLEEARTSELPCIEIQEKLLKQFEELYKKIKKSFAIEDKDYVKIQLNSLQNHWALWLDVVEPQIRNLCAQKNIAKQSLISQAEKFTEYFKKFDQEMTEMSSKNNIFKLVDSIEEMQKLGMHFKKKKEFDKAIECFNKVIEIDSEFAEKAHYYKVACLIEKDHEKNKSEIKSHLQKAKFLMAKRISNLNYSSLILDTANKNINQQGIGTSSNSYAMQMQDEVKLLHLHINAIDEIIGVPIEANAFLYKSGANDQEQSEKVFDILRKNQKLVKDFRISRKVYLGENEEGNKIFIKKFGKREEIITRDLNDKFSCDLFDFLKTKINKLKFSDRILAPKDFIFEGMTAEQGQMVFNSLVMSGVIKQPTIFFNLKNESDKNKIETRIDQIKKDIEKVVLEKFPGKNSERYVADIKEAFDHAIGTLKLLPAINVSYQNIMQYCQTGKFPQEAYGKLQDALFDELIQFAEKKPWWNWNAFAVAMFGIAQVVGGVTLTLCTAGIGASIGSALIGEGVNDILFATLAGIQQNFSWTDYLVNKTVSVAIATATIGIGAWVSSVKDARELEHLKKIGDIEGIKKFDLLKKIREIPRKTHLAVELASKGESFSLAGTILKESAIKGGVGVATGLLKIGTNMAIGKAFQMGHEIIKKQVIQYLCNLIGMDKLIIGDLVLLKDNMIKLYQVSYERDENIGDISQKGKQAKNIVENLLYLVERELDPSKFAIYDNIYSLVKVSTGIFTDNADAFIDVDRANKLAESYAKNLIDSKRLKQWKEKYINAKESGWLDFGMLLGKQVCANGINCAKIIYECRQIVGNLNKEIGKKIDELKSEGKILEKNDIDNELFSNYADQLIKQVKNKIMNRFSLHVDKAIMQPSVQTVLNFGIDKASEKILKKLQNEEDKQKKEEKKEEEESKNDLNHLQQYLNLLQQQLKPDNQNKDNSEQDLDGDVEILTSKKENVPIQTSIMEANTNKRKRDTVTNLEQPSLNEQSQVKKMRRQPVSRSFNKQINQTEVKRNRRGPRRSERIAKMVKNAKNSKNLREQKIFEVAKKPQGKFFQSSNDNKLLKKQSGVKKDNHSSIERVPLGKNRIKNRVGNLHGAAGKEKKNQEQKQEQMQKNTQSENQQSKQPEKQQNTQLKQQQNNQQSGQNSGIKKLKPLEQFMQEMEQRIKERENEKKRPIVSNKPQAFFSEDKDKISLLKNLGIKDLNSEEAGKIWILIRRVEENISDFDQSQLKPDDKFDELSKQFGHIKAEQGWELTGTKITGAGRIIAHPEKSKIVVVNPSAGLSSNLENNDPVLSIRYKLYSQLKALSEAGNVDKQNCLKVAIKQQMQTYSDYLDYDKHAGANTLPILGKEITSRIFNMAEGESYVVATGYNTHITCHKFSVENQQIVITIYNGGNGCEYHKFSDNGMVYPYSFVPLPKSNSTQKSVESYVSGLLANKDKPAKESLKFMYQKISSPLIKPDGGTPKKPAMPIQTVGNCSWHNLTEALRDSLKTKNADFNKELIDNENETCQRLRVERQGLNYADYLNDCKWVKDNKSTFFTNQSNNQNANQNISQNIKQNINQNTSQSINQSTNTK